MGSAIFATGQVLHSNIPLWEDLYRWRRSPHRLAALLGLPIAFAMLRGRLRLTAVEARASALTGAPARAVESSGAGLAYDIDTREHYDYAVQHTEQTPQGTG